MIERASSTRLIRVIHRNQILIAVNLGMGVGLLILTIWFFR